MKYHETLLLSHRSWSACEDGGYREFYLFIYLFFPVTKLSNLSESFLIIGPFIFLHYLCIKFPTATRLYYLNCNNFPILHKSPEEGRLVRPKYRETLSRFSLFCFVIYVYIIANVVYLIAVRAGCCLCEEIF